MPVSPIKSGAITLDDLKSLIAPRITATVTVPSKGQFYGSTLPNGEVELCPLSAREDKLLAIMGGSSIDSIVETVLRRCMITKFDVDELLLTDRFYLLLALRANSFGTDYKYDLECDCGFRGTYSTNLLTELTVVNPKETDKEPFSTVLPDSKLKVSYRLLRGRDQKILGRTTVDNYFKSLATQIISINDRSIEPNITEKLLESLSAKDIIVLKEVIDISTPGVLTAVKKQCAACGHIMNVDMPLTAEFFRPKFTTTS